MKHAGLFGAQDGVFGPMLGHVSGGIFGTKEGVFGPMLGQATQLAVPGGVLGAYAVGRRTAHAALGAVPPAPLIEDAQAADDVAESSVYKGDVVTAMRQQRGFVAVPAYDLREYVRQQLGTIALGFGVGVAVGAALGNIFNPRKP